MGHPHPALAFIPICSPEVVIQVSTQSVLPSTDLYSHETCGDSMSSRALLSAYLHAENKALLKSIKKKQSHTPSGQNSKASLCIGIQYSEDTKKMPLVIICLIIIFNFSNLGISNYNDKLSCSSSPVQKIVASRVWGVPGLRASYCAPKVGLSNLMRTNKLKGICVLYIY